MKPLRAWVREGRTLIGCFLSLPSPLTTEIVGMAGYDWVVIDLEHGASSAGQLLGQLQALEHTGAAAIVRIESCDRPRFLRVLDLGVSGVMVPRVDDAELARSAVAALRYPPEGIRGVAKNTRATGFGTNFEAYAQNANSSLLGVMQIESEEALNNVDEIAAVDGVDVVFVGPLDLSFSMGIPDQYSHPRFQEAVRMTVASALKHGKAAGILVRRPEDLPAYHKMGIRFLACGNDADFVNQGARCCVTNAKKLLA